MSSFAYGALWIFIFVVPWENMIVIPGLGTISKLVGMLALVCTVFAPLVSGRVRRLRLFHVSALIFVLCAGAGVFRAIDQRWALLRSGTYLQLFLVLWMIWELAPTVRRQRGLLTAYVLGAYVGAAATIVAYLTGSGTSATSRRFSAEGFDANALGTILALAIPMAWYLGLTYRHPILRWVCRGYLPVAIFAIGLTASRGAMVVGTIALLIVPAAMTRLSPGRMVGAIMLLIACGTLAAVYVPKQSLDRLGTISSEVEEGRFGGRGKVWMAGLRAFAQKPFMGYGTGSFKPAVAQYMGQPIVAHNTYLSVLVEQGILGFVPWFTMFIAVFVQMRKLPPLERRFGLVLIATLGIAILPLTWDDRKPVWVILAVLAAFAEALRPARAGTTQMPQPHPLRPVPVTRRAVTPLARAYPTSRPSADPHRDAIQ
jgi:O-antigen ligase